jgi:hypothetical protein
MLWFFSGSILTVAILALILLLRRWKVTVSWYEWLLGTIGLALMLFSFQNYYSSRVEFEPVAPGMFLLFFGLPGIIILIIMVGLVCWHYIASNKKSVQDVIANRKGEGK